MPFCPLKFMLLILSLWVSRQHALTEVVLMIIARSTLTWHCMMSPVSKTGDFKLFETCSNCTPLRHTVLLSLNQNDMFWSSGIFFMLSRSKSDLFGHSKFISSSETSVTPHRGSLRNCRGARATIVVNSFYFRKAKRSSCCFSRNPWMRCWASLALF